MEKTVQNKTEKENNLGIENTHGTENDIAKGTPKERPTSKRRSRRRLPAW